jgi:hypothetical protein
MQDRKLQVQIDKWASPDEVQAVEETFRRVGLEASVRAGVIELSEQFTWIVIISMPASMFLSGYFAAAGADAWSATKNLSDRLRHFVQGSERRSRRQSGRKDRARGWGPGVAASVERPAGGGVPPTGSPRLVSSSKRITPMGRPGSMLDALRAWDGSAAGVQAPTLGRRDYQLGKPNGYGCLTC